MFKQKNVVCEVHYFYHDKPEEILFKVLHNFYNTKDIPWPYMFRSGLSFRMHLSQEELIQSDYIHRQESVYLSHSLWTCKCDPKITGSYIHTKSAPICLNCKQMQKDSTPRLKYFYEVFPYEVKDYKFDEKEGFNHVMAHYKDAEQKINTKYMH